MDTKDKTSQNGKQVDVYALVTERIIEQLEKGAIPWRKPWSDGGLPRNLFSKKPYWGINLMLLSSLGYEHNLFVTFNQLKEIGGKVKKDEKACPIVFWNYADPENEEGKRKAFIRYYSVFNIAQCEGIPENYIPAQPARIIGSIHSCEEVVANMPQCPYIQHKEQRAYYNPLQDFVNMPKKSSFSTAESYYVTLFHELIHATGHHSRLARKDLIEMAEFGSDTYSHEELVAEIGACYLQSHTGVLEEFAQSTAYIHGWLTKLKNDKRFIYSAAFQTQRAVDFILKVQQENEENQEA